MHCYIHNVIEKRVFDFFFKRTIIWIDRLLRKSKQSLFMVQCCFCTYLIEPNVYVSEEQVFV